MEKVPFLVCLTFADKLYAECMTRDGQHPDKMFMIDELGVQLSVSLTTRLIFLCFKYINQFC